MENFDFMGFIDWDVKTNHITREKIDDLRMSLDYSEEWIKDYINKNFKELTDEEKLYLEAL